MILLAIVFFSAVSSINSQVYHNGRISWQYWLRDRPRHFNYETSGLNGEFFNVGDINFIMKHPSYDNIRELNEEPPLPPRFVLIRPKWPPPTSSPPPPPPLSVRFKPNFIARFNGSRLILPGERSPSVTRRQLESVIRDLQSPASVPVLSSDGSYPTSLDKYLRSTTIVDGDPQLDDRVCVFDDDIVLPVPATLSVLRFYRFLVEQSVSPSSPVQLSMAKAENVSAFLEYLTHQDDVTIECMSQLPFRYVQKILESAPSKIQDKMILKIYHFRIPFKVLKRFFYK